MVVQNDSETIERAFRSFYDHVEAIAVSADTRCGWTGESITPDETIDIIKSLDVDNKTDILEASFFIFDEPMKNETFQRQITADWLASKIKGLEWICQVDADEEFLDFNQVVNYLSQMPKWTKGVRWEWVQVFNILDDGRLLIVVDEEDKISLMPFYLAHRPHSNLIVARLPAIHSFNLNKQTLRLNEILLRSNKYIKFIKDFDGSQNPSGLCLHYTFAKSEKRIEEKLRTWGHAKEFDTEAFLKLWKRSKTEWQQIRDFHPQVPEAWKALKPFTLEQLKNLSSFQIS